MSENIRPSNSCLYWYKAKQKVAHFCPLYHWHASVKKKQTLTPLFIHWTIRTKNTLVNKFSQSGRIYWKPRFTPATNNLPGKVIRHKNTRVLKYIFFRETNKLDFWLETTFFIIVLLNTRNEKLYRAERDMYAFSVSHMTVKLSSVYTSTFLPANTQSNVPCKESGRRMSCKRKEVSQTNTTWSSKP